jgi:hypothetical protein
MSDLAQLLDEMESERVWDALNPPCEEKNLARIALRNPLPDDLKTLLVRAHGAKLGDLSIFTLQEFEDVNILQDSYLVNMPSAVFFGSDGGDGFFFVDTDGSLGRGREAVFWGDRGAMLPDLCVPCGDNLESFLSPLIRGEKVWKGPNLEECAVEAMVKALPDKRNQWIGCAGADLKTIFRIKNQCKVGAPSVLKELLGQSNGITFLKTGITFRKAEAIAPVGVDAESGLPFALLIGDDEEGNQYVITTGIPTNLPQGWPTLAGRVVRLTPGRPLEEAQPLGYLPDVVLEWLGVDKWSFEKLGCAHC